MYYYKKGLGNALLQHWERDKYYNRGNRGCIITKRDWGMHYCNIGNGINITTGGTGNALLQHWEQRINITTGGTGDKYYNRGIGDG